MEELIAVFATGITFPVLVGAFVAAYAATGGKARWASWSGQKRRARALAPALVPVASRPRGSGSPR